MPIIYDNRLIKVPALYGDGSDGNVTISSNTTLSREMFYENLVVNPSVTVTTSTRICVKGTLNNYGTIRALANSGSGASGGSDTTDAYLGASQSGGTGSPGGANGSAPTANISRSVPAPDCRGGIGGNTTSFTGGAAGNTINSLTSLTVLDGPATVNLSILSLGNFTTGTYDRGTSGGGGAAAASSTGGGGGARGKVLTIHADIINNFGSIEAKGGNGANGTGVEAGGGGGGGGGMIFLIARLIMDVGTVTAAGGSGGSGVGGGLNGASGNSGTITKITSV